MKALSAMAGLCVLCSLWGAAAQAEATSVSVIPAPAHVETRDGQLVISAGTPVTATGGPEADHVARYFTQLVAGTTAISLKVRSAVAGTSQASSAGSLAPGDTNAGGHEASDDRHAPIGGAPSGIVFRLDPAHATTTESYSLEVSPTGVSINASSANGLFYGAVTLWQLITAQSGQAGASAAAIASAGGKARSVTLRSLRITDEPRFAWRGLMIDVARHYMPPDSIKQMLDWMALHKLNTFHWHLTDDQGWRLEIKKYPRLTEVGAWRVPAGAAPAADLDPKTGRPRLYGGFYTQAEVRDIVKYAADRFITVVPEIEMPGHAQAAIAAYPRLGTEGAPPPVSSDWGVHNYLYNVDDATFAFLEDVLIEVMALFPGTYIHVGGDEAAKDRWIASPSVQRRMRELGIANETALQSYFTHRMEKFLSAHGRKLIGWDEILEGGLPQGAAVMSWRGAQGAVEAASQGHDVVMAPVPDLYLDYLQSDSANEPPGRPRYVTLADMYKFDLMPAALQGDAARHVMGAQLNAWTEHMRTPARVQHAVFPRLAAFAENVWSSPDHRDWSDFAGRLPAQLARYQKLGIDFADSAFEVRVMASISPPAKVSTPASAASQPALMDAPASTARVELSNQIGSGEIRYTLNGQAPSVSSPEYSAPLVLRMPTTLTAATFVGGQRLSTPRVRKLDRASLLRRNSDELQSCSNKLPLRLEDDAPRTAASGVGSATAASGANDRAVFNVDILDPCWVWKGADLSRVKAIGASVGQIPFNFQVGADVKQIPLYAPQSPAGELEVRVDSCSGARIAVLPLAQAVGQNGITSLTNVAISSAGVHDLCLRFTRRGVDPIWAIDSVQLFE